MVGFTIFNSKNKTLKIVCRKLDQDMLKHMQHLIILNDIITFYLKQWNTFSPIDQLNVEIRVIM